MKFLKQTLVLALLVIFSSCESDSVVQNETTADYQLTIVNQSKSVELGEAYVEWNEEISESHKERVREDLIVREFLFFWEPCPENPNGETWGYDTQHIGKPKVQTESNTDYDRWEPNKTCPE